MRNEPSFGRFCALRNVYSVHFMKTKQAHVKTLENGLMMFTTKENCTLTVKDLYMCKKKKIQQTNPSKTTMHPDSHT